MTSIAVLRIAKMKVNWLKNQVRDKLTGQLSESLTCAMRDYNVDYVYKITGNHVVRMNYVSLEIQYRSHWLAQEYEVYQPKRHERHLGTSTRVKHSVVRQDVQACNAFADRT